MKFPKHSLCAVAHKVSLIGEDGPYVRDFFHVEATTDDGQTGKHYYPWENADEAWLMVEKIIDMDDDETFTASNRFWTYEPHAQRPDVEPDEYNPISFHFNL